MKVKVQCSCGTKFEFEVEPIDGKMPSAIGCPACGLNATELANTVIRQQSAPPPPGLRISKTHSAPANPVPAPQAAAPQTSSAAVCLKHPLEPAMETCRVCGKPICAKCMEQFGYVCSVYCRQQSIQQRMAIPVYAHQKNIGEDKPFQIFKTIVLSSLVVGAIVVGFLVWYGWFARNPKVVYSLSTPVIAGNPNRTLHPGEYYQLIASGELLSVKDKHAALYNLGIQVSVWNTPLQTEADATDYDLSNPLVAITTNDVWLAFRDRVLRLDRRTGERKEPTILGRILSFSSDDAALMVIYVNPDGQRLLTRISLPDAVAQTAELYQSGGALKPSVQILARKGIVHTNLSSPPVESNDPIVDRATATSAAVERNLKMSLQTDGNSFAPSRTPTGAIDEMSSYAFNHEEVSPFVLAGPNVIQFNTKLLEQRSATTAPAAKPKGKSILDDGNVTASQGVELAQEMVSAAQQETADNEDVEDVSRYQVTLHRWFANDAPDWTGEVIGPPFVYSLKAVDLLVAGQSLIVFDKHNKKLWEGKLTYPLRATDAPPPYVETADSLYFADPGVLTRFDLATGNVRWRMDSVGIGSLQMDTRQNLYVASTTAGPDHIAHPHQINLREKIHPLMMKVNSANGRIVWQTEADGAACFISGKFLYTTWTARVQSVMRLEEGPDTHYNLWLIDPSTGNEIWEYHKVNRPVIKTQFQKNWILLQYEDGVTVLKFFSF